MFGAQGGYPPPQQGYYDPGQMRHGPPPAKKAKNNPIITRYPPPPGYRGPGQPQAPYQQPGWPHPPQPYSHGQQYPGYPPQGYGQPQPFPQNQMQGYAQHPNNGYPPNYYPQQSHQGWTAPVPSQPPSASQSHPANWQIPPTPQPQSAPPNLWPPTGIPPSSKRRHHSEPFVNAQGGNAGPVVDGNGEPLPAESPRPEIVRPDFQDDFDGECYFLRHPEEINADFSLGEIVWQPALPTNLALPSTWKESQLEIIAPRKNPPPGETSVSEYFFREKRDEALLSIRLTDDWFKIRDDLIFKEFTERPKRLLSVAEMLNKYKDRPDPTWVQRSPSATPEPKRNAVAGAMVADRSYMADHDARSQADGEEEDVLGNLESALRQNSVSRQGRHSRANSTTSISSNHSTKLKPLMPVRDRAQDDILAALGVTGSPKMVYQTPGPAFGPPPPDRDGSVSRNHSRQSSVVSNSGATRVPPPPPPGQPLEYARRPSIRDTLNSKDRQYRNDYGHNRPGSNGYDNSRRGSNGYDNSRRGSNASRHESNPSRPGSSGSRGTTRGSDFGGGDDERTPRPKYYRTDSRKRGYEDDYAGRDDDATPRQQRYYKQPRVDDAYGRRW